MQIFAYCAGEFENILRGLLEFRKSLVDARKVCSGGPPRMDLGCDEL